MNIFDNMNDVINEFYSSSDQFITRQKEVEFMRELDNIAQDYLLSTRGKTEPNLADFLMVLQSQVDANDHERARVR